MLRLNIYLCEEVEYSHGLSKVTEKSPWFAQFDRGIQAFAGGSDQFLRVFIDFSNGVGRIDVPMIALRQKN